MIFQFNDVRWPAFFDARLVAMRARRWLFQQWTLFACAFIGISARAGSESLPVARLEWVLAAASMSAGLVLWDAWGRDADDIRGGSAKAVAAAALCALAAAMVS